MEINPEHDLHCPNGHLAIEYLGHRSYRFHAAYISGQVGPEKAGYVPWEEYLLCRSCGAILQSPLLQFNGCVFTSTPELVAGGE